MHKLTDGEFLYLSRLLRSNATNGSARASGVAAREKDRADSIEKKLKQLR